MYLYKNPLIQMPSSFGKAICSGKTGKAQVRKAKRERDLYVFLCRKPKDEYLMSNRELLRCGAQALAWTHTMGITRCVGPAVASHDMLTRGVGLKSNKQLIGEDWSGEKEFSVEVAGLAPSLITVICPPQGETPRVAEEWLLWETVPGCKPWWGMCNL